jgi:hypothetical protein
MANLSGRRICRKWQHYNKGCFLVAILFGSNYLGGKLILQHHVGVKNMEL